MIIYTVVCFIPTQIWGYYANIVVGILCPLIVIGGGTACLQSVLNAI